MRCDHGYVDGIRCPICDERPSYNRRKSQPPAKMIYVCICPDPRPKPVKLFGCTMPGFQECQRCFRPVTTADPPPPPTIGGAVVPRPLSSEPTRRG